MEKIIGDNKKQQPYNNPILFIYYLMKIILSLIIWNCTFFNEKLYTKSTQQHLKQRIK
jgi:hypothetical protein